jgi:hypothetical protein
METEKKNRNTVSHTNKTDHHDITGISMKYCESGIKHHNRNP